MPRAADRLDRTRVASRRARFEHDPYRIVADLLNRFDKPNAKRANVESKP
jgi:hypothetical protein